MQQLPIPNIAAQINIIDKVYDLNMFVIVISMLIVFMLLMKIKVSYKSYYADLWFGIVHINTFGKVYTERGASYMRAGAIMQAATILSVATAIFTVFSYAPSSWGLVGDFNFRLSINEISFSKILYILLKYIYLIVIVIAIIFSYWVITSAIGYVVGISKITTTYFNLSLNILKMISIILFTICIVLPFANEEKVMALIYIMLCLFLLSFIYKIIIFILLSIKIKFFNLYSILYFCTFEILPLLFLGKLVFQRG